MSSDVENGYTFRMGDHEITMRDSFASMLDTTQLTDCLLVCHTHLKDGVSEAGVAAENGLTNGHTSPVPSASRRTSVVSAKANPTEQILRTHRVILSASSDYFRSVFATVSNTLTNGVVAVIVTNVDFEDLEAIVNFIYKGQVSVGQSRIHKFLASAQMLMIKGLMNIKLVNNDDQPIDETTFAENELIQRLKAEKRQLELDMKAAKEREASKAARIRREIETELKKKLELEKSILSEEKQRFAAEKMKFTIEKELFDKKRSKEMSAKINNSSVNCVNCNNSPNKQIIVNNDPNKSILIQTLTQNGGQIGGNKTNPNEMNITTRSLRSITPNKPVVESPQKQDNTQSLAETPTNEPEGRQLRKRIKLSDNTEGKESTDVTSETVDVGQQKMDVVEEDGEEVYEVDFSQGGDVCASSGAPQEPKQNTVNGDDNKQTEEMDSTPQKSAIIASAVAFHKGAPPPAPPTHQMPTRSLRRSTSSIGSASTQSISGENGTDGDSSLRRKGAIRTPNWPKEESIHQNLELSSENDSTPVTRARQQRVSQELTPTATGKSNLYTCPYCPQEYHAENSMQDHINGVHLNQKTQYICDYCGKVYTWRISLNKHLRTVHPNEPIPE